jgi:hypothetical protein
MNGRHLQNLDSSHSIASRLGGTGEKACGRSTCKTSEGGSQSNFGSSSVTVVLGCIYPGAFILLDFGGRLTLTAYRSLNKTPAGVRAALVDMEIIGLFRVQGGLVGIHTAINTR